jgi:hypothetical protein
MKKNMFWLQIENNVRNKHLLLLYDWRGFFFFISTFQLEFQLETNDMHNFKVGISS